MRVSGKLWSLIFVMLMMAIVFGASLQMETVKLRLLPLIISFSLFVLAGVEIVRELRGKVETPTTRRHQKESVGAKQEALGYLSISLWIGGFFLAVYFLGFIFSVPCFILTYMRSQGTSWKLSVVIAGITVGFIYVVFELFLSVGLHEGILWMKIQSLF